MSNKIMMYAIAAALTVAVVAAVYLRLQAEGTYAGATMFDSEVWMSPSSYEYIDYESLPTPRQKMFTSLPTLLKDKSEAEIRVLLGEPNDKMAETGAQLVYVLGPEQGMGVDFEWALIYLDNEGVFSRIERATD